MLFKIDIYNTFTTIGFNVLIVGNYCVAMHTRVAFKAYKLTNFLTKDTSQNTPTLESLM